MSTTPGGLQAPPAYGTLTSKITSMHTTLLQTEDRLRDVEARRMKEVILYDSHYDVMKELEHKAKVLMEQADALRPTVKTHQDAAEGLMTQVVVLEDYIRDLRAKYEQSLKLYKELEAATEDLPPFPSMNGATPVHPAPSSVTTVKMEHTPPFHSPHAAKRGRDSKTMDEVEEEADPAPQTVARKLHMSKNSRLEDDMEEEDDVVVMEAPQPEKMVLAAMSDADVAMYGHHGVVEVDASADESRHVYTMVVVADQIWNVAGKFKSMNTRAAMALGTSTHAVAYGKKLQFKTKYADLIKCTLEADDVQTLHDDRLVKSKVCSVCGQGFQMGWDIVFTCATHIAHSICLMVVQDVLRNCNPKELKFYNECPAKFTMSTRGCNPLK